MVASLFAGSSLFESASERSFDSTTHVTLWVALIIFFITFVFMCVMFGYLVKIPTGVGPTGPVGPTGDNYTGPNPQQGHSGPRGQPGSYGGKGFQGPTGASFTNFQQLNLVSSSTTGNTITNLSGSTWYSIVQPKISGTTILNTITINYVSTLNPGDTFALDLTGCTTNISVTFSPNSSSTNFNIWYANNATPTMANCSLGYGNVYLCTYFGTITINYQQKNSSGSGSTLTNSTYQNVIIIHKAGSPSYSNYTK